MGGGGREKKAAAAGRANEPIYFNWNANRCVLLDENCCVPGATRPPRRWPRLIQPGWIAEIAGHFGDPRSLIVKNGLEVSKKIAWESFHWPTVG